MSDSAYKAYIDPPDDALFSAAFLNQLTFARAFELELPVQLEPGAVVRHAFYDTVPTRPGALVIGSGECVPAASDLKAIIDALPAAYTRGSRSVVLTIKKSHSARPFVSTCHFQKVRFRSHDLCTDYSHCLDPSLPASQHQS